MTRILHGTLIVMLIALFSGCAFGTRHANLREITVASRTPDAGSRAVSIYVSPVEDCRAERSSIGCVRNGFGMRTAEVVCRTDVCEWARNCIAASLRKAGYDVHTEAHSPQCEITLNTMMDKAFCESYMKYKAEVSLGIELTTAGKVVKRGNYKGVASSMNWAATASGFAKNVEAAMQKCLRRMMSDIIPALQRET